MTARALAQDLDLPVTSDDLATLDNRELREAWSRLLASAPCMALLEDVDGVFDGRTNKRGEAGGRLTFDGLLDCLGGLVVPRGVLTVVTTNHPEGLDPALGIARGDGTRSSRPGRLDRAVTFGPLDEAGRRHLAARVLDGLDAADQERLVAEGAGDTGAQFVDRCAAFALAVSWGEAGVGGAHGVGHDHDDGPIGDGQVCGAQVGGGPVGGGPDGDARVCGGAAAGAQVAGAQDQGSTEPSAAAGGNEGSPPTLVAWDLITQLRRRPPSMNVLANLMEAQLQANRHWQQQGLPRGGGVAQELVVGVCGLGPATGAAVPGPPVPGNVCESWWDAVARVVGINGETEPAPHAPLRTPVAAGVSVAPQPPTT